jgi:hypothetical protein
VAEQFRKAPESPVGRPGRAYRARSGRAGLAIVLVGLAVLVTGLLASHRVAGNRGEAIPEWRLVQLATYGGIRRLEPNAASPTTQAAESAAKIQKVDKPPSQCPT